MLDRTRVVCFTAVILHYRPTGSVEGRSLNESPSRHMEPIPDGDSGHLGISRIFDVTFKPIYNNFVEVLLLT